MWEWVKALPNDKISDWSKLKALADDEINGTEISKFVFGRIKNIVGIEENADYQYFLLFLQCFQNASFSRLLKVRIVWKWVKSAFSEM